MTQANIPRQTQPKDREQDEFDQDLHPNRNAGINHEERGANPEQDAPNAETMTQIHNIVPELTNDELRRIVVLQPGDRLEQGATYLDLRSPSRTEFTADAGMTATKDNLFVPKSVTEYELWNRLTGRDQAERGA
jgi:hypothetical protein